MEATVDSKRTQVHHFESLVGRSVARMTGHSLGRPARLWDLTAAAAERFPDSHADLTVDLLESMQDAFGEDGLDRLLAVRAKRQLAAYRERMPPPEAALDKRVAALAKLRREEGYMAQWSRTKDENGALMLTENHCPICAAAQTCQGLCRDELALFQELLPDAEVERTEHLLEGARRCAYRVVPR